jgi:DNA mismatch repair ATPase MutS
LRKIVRIAGAAGVQQSHLLGFLVNIVVPWDLFFADRLNRYKVWAKDTLPLWIDRWYDLEALSSLATHSYLNPDSTFPEILNQEGGPVLQARALGHPLLPENARVHNDFSFDRPGDIALITGSNMSGKSTFLRTLGVNLCLAYAGAAVHAEKLRAVPLRLFTCIQVADSVTDGISYFYAEVRRLKALLTALNAEDEPPLLYLIDEIFRGTNNHERLAGSRDYIRALAKGRGVGVISTHDLELIGMAEDLPGIHNVHFREEIRDGRMAFDYRLRPGPCPTTNALKIMRMAGLPVSGVCEG